MKKVFVLSFVLLLISTFSFAANFAPTPMRLIGPDNVNYAFDGSSIDIPITVTGTPVFMRFLVYTKGKAAEINDIRNGHLGWHYMNKIDTCIYQSGDYKFTPGTNTVTWSGKDNDGGQVPDGAYTYYLWGFDDLTARTKAVPKYVIGSEYGDRTREEFLLLDEAGIVLATPVWKHRYFRWVMGSDPEDQNLFETSTFDMGEGWGNIGFGQWVYNPADWSSVYAAGFNSETTTCKSVRFNWVPNDASTLDDGYDQVTFSTLNNYLTQISDGQYIYIGESNYKETVVRTYVHIIDFENSEYVGYIDQSEVWESVNDYENMGGLMNGGYTLFTYTPSTGIIAGGNHCCCLRAGFSGISWFDDEEDTMRWENGNGDYVAWDNNWELTSEQPWACNSLGAKRSNHGWTHDQYGFQNSGQYHGAMSFEVGAPDGTGIGQFSYAGEVDAAKGGGIICDNGSAYDGSYVPKTGEGGAGRWFVGRDTFMGVISSGVGVAEAAPGAFSVAQNSPNPFNPTTTVSMMLAEAGNVTIDVFNVAGQKIDTLVDGFKEAGSHSVVWDASDFSAGVYFCTVRSGDFSKTVKMTLLK